MNLLDWAFYVAGMFCLIEAGRFRPTWQPYIFSAGLGLMGAAVLAAAI